MYSIFPIIVRKPTYPKSILSLFLGFSDLNEDDEQKSEDNSSDSEDAIAVDKNGPKIGDLVNTSS